MKPKSLSTFERTSLLTGMAAQQLDLLVIGGGITGAGIALDAASRGLKVGLVEKQDFAAGTSSRSTKLIHGGLRYLKQGEIRLVREVGRERAILHRNAPHLVLPEKMLLPLVEGGTYGRLATSFGLWLYDRLAGVKHVERRIMLSRRQTLDAEPLLKEKIVKGGGLYIEYRTDDARLTIEVMKTAARYGAACVNYVEAMEPIYEQGRLVGFEVQDRLSGDTYRIFARRIVNAAGPWSDRIREKDGSLSSKRLHLTRGVHLVVPHEKFPIRQSVYFDVPDGRMLFAIPRGQTTYIGTTDTNYSGKLESPGVTQQDVDYLLDAVRYMFPEVQLKPSDITSSWSGLRPLIHEDGKSPSELSRKDEIFLSPTGLITIAGGKLTGYRKMAERVTDLVLTQLAEESGSRQSIAPCKTDQIVLSGGDFASPDAVSSYIMELTKHPALIGVDRWLIADLVKKYGTNSADIVKRYANIRAEHTEWTSEQALMAAELDYAISEEMTTNLNDFLVRRTGRVLFDRRSIDSALLILTQEMANRLKWSPEHRELAMQAFRDEYEAAVAFA